MTINRNPTDHKFLNDVCIWVKQHPEILAKLVTGDVRGADVDAVIAKEQEEEQKALTDYEEEQFIWEDDARWEDYYKEEVWSGYDEEEDQYGECYHPGVIFNEHCSGCGPPGLKREEENPTPRTKFWTATYRGKKS